ncbi:uncharacterized protein LOC116607025 isoform X3 [Nematostella vectensis]|uniref:uncharacterized protein LOC116607025 isoform X3 n=1 Tax=Nematostella vectensis TaxID=45351 RepID=UPI00207756E3|nr:uncharacterized protein LOC116607025 isoform X3 [Nematostella vectensis]
MNSPRLRDCIMAHHLSTFLRCLSITLTHQEHCINLHRDHLQNIIFFTETSGVYQAAFVQSSELRRSSESWSMSTNRSFLKFTTFFANCGLQRSSSQCMAWWSEVIGFRTEIPLMMSSSDQVITRSRVWPSLCVMPLTCCFRSNASNMLENFLAYLSLASSMWRLKSPINNS